MNRIFLERTLQSESELCCLIRFDKRFFKSLNHSISNYIFIVNVCFLCIICICFSQFSVGTNQEFEARFHTCDDKEFYQLHESIIRKAGDQKISVSSLHNSTIGGSGSSATGKFTVMLKFLLGEAGQLRKDQSMLFKNVIEVRRLGFPNVIMPGDVRLVLRVYLYIFINIHQSPVVVC